METWKKNLEDVFSKWEKKDAPPPPLSEHGISVRSSDTDVNHINRRPPQRTGRRRRQLRNRDQEVGMKDELFTPTKFKLLNPVLKAPRQIYRTKTCNKCENQHKGKNEAKGPGSCSNLFNVLDVLAYSRRKQVTDAMMPDFGFVCSRKCFNYPYITVKHISSSKRISKLVARVEESEEKNLSRNTIEVISSLHRRISANVSNTFLRLAAWVLLKFFRTAFSNVCCQTEDMIAVKNASKRDIPIIYLPLHKSHLDYLIISFILYCNDIRVPFTAAGDNLSSSSLIGYVLHKLGAFFIRRKKITKDENLYNAFLQEYVERLLKKNQSIQIFIEGTRSRTGKPSLPKAGILSIVTNAFMKGVIDDFMIVPVNISYERVPEVEAYSSELLGSEKVPENIWQLTRSVYNLMTSLNGQIHVRFGKPKSFEAFFGAEKQFPTNNEARETFEQNVPVTPFCNEASVVKTTKNLADHVINDCYNVGAITSTSMVSFLLITKYMSGVAVEELEEAFDWLKEQILHFSGSSSFIGQTDYVVGYAVEILRQQGLVAISAEAPCLKAHVKPSEELGKFLSLVFYSNQVSSMFVVEAVVATSIISAMGGASLFKMGQTSVDAVSREEILSSSKRLYDLLSREHKVIPPCKDIETTFSDVLDSFVASGVLDVLTSVTYDDLRSRKLVEHMANWDVGEEEDYCQEGSIDLQYKINANGNNRSKMIHLNSVIAPLLESYWLVAASLHKMIIGDNQIEETDLLKSLHVFALERVRQGITEYVESASLVTIKSAMATFVSMGVLTSDVKGGKKVVQLSREFTQPESLNYLIHEINSCR